MSVLKRLRPVVAGLVVGVAITAAGEYFSQSVYPLPAGVDIHDKAQMVAAMETMPPDAFYLLLAIYAIGALAAGIVATIMSRRTYLPFKSQTAIDAALRTPASARPAIICGVVLTIAGLANSISLPHPMWFVVANAIIYIPAAYIGFMINSKSNR